MKLFRIALLICALAALLTVSAAADTVEYAVTGGNIYFDTETGAITGCDTSVTEAYIPAKISGVSVTSIGDGAFEDCSGLTAVEIPNSVTSIRMDAFYGCSGLTAVKIPNSVTSIGFRAFLGCRGLTAITIPNSVTSIGDIAFYGCTGLTAVTIPNSVTSIGEETFSACWGLIVVTIPNSVVSIASDAFSFCTSLNAINVDSANSEYTSVNGILFNHEKTELICYPAGKSGMYTIPDSVTFIGDSAFSGCRGLTAVTIPNSVVSIAADAFIGCTGLNAINVDSANSEYTSVNGILFNHEKTGLICYPAGKIGAYTVPNSVTSIDDWAFYGCKGLTVVTIGNSVTSIGDRAFLNCTGLTAIEIPNSVTTIGFMVFSGCTDLTAVTIGDNVTSIGKYLFRGCTGLTMVTIPNSVTSIGYMAFLGCTGLTAMEIPNSVTTIDGYVFSGCDSLTAVTIPVSVISIGYGAFENCIGLEDVYYGGTEAQWSKIDIGRNNNPLINAQIHYNSAGPEPIPTAFASSAPVTRDGGRITATNLATLTEITVPVQYTGDTAQAISVAVAFYDENGRFVGFGIASDSVSNGRKDVTVPISGITNAARMKTLLMNAESVPLCGAGVYEIPAV